MNDKVRHVKEAGQTRGHHCHWPDCDKQVPPAMWGCPRHWFALPTVLRSKIWATYVVGQEDRMDPSEDYMQAAEEVQYWIKSHRKIP